MKHPKVLALILAGGQGSRLGALTKQRAKPALPFAGSYRLIDFPLSNCVHSQIENVWIIEQYQTHSLNEHLTNGRPWDLDRTHGGLQILPPHQSTLQNDEEDGGAHGDGGWSQGNADALFRNRRFIRQFNPDLILVLSADAVYRYDYRDLVAAHLQRNAEVTMLCTDVATEEATRFGNLQSNRNHRVTRFEYKPEKPISSSVTTEVFLYDAAVLLQVLEELGERAAAEIQNDSQRDDDETVALNDFGHELLPAFVARKRAFALQLDGDLGDYWRDVGTVESYWQTQMDFLQSPPFDLDDAAWPIRTRGQMLLPAKIENAEISNALISSACRVAGTVKNSILSPGVRVEAGAQVENSVLLHNAVIARGAVVKHAIVDEGAHVETQIIGSKRKVQIVENSGS